MAHVVGCANGLDAIEIALRANGIGKGDRVLTTPLSAFATALAIIRAGAEPVFADVDASGLLDLELADQALADDPLIRAVLPVHLFGHAQDLGRLEAITEHRGVIVIEDAHRRSAHGATADPLRPSASQRRRASIPRRTSARWAMAARSSRTTNALQRWPAAFATTVRAPSTYTTGSGSTVASTNCRPPSCATRCYLNWRPASAACRDRRALPRRDRDTRPVPASEPVRVGVGLAPVPSPHAGRARPVSRASRCTRHRECRPLPGAHDRPGRTA